MKKMVRLIITSAAFGTFLAVPFTADSVTAENSQAVSVRRDCGKLDGETQLGHPTMKKGEKNVKVEAVQLSTDKKEEAEETRIVSDSSDVDSLVEIARGYEEAPYAFGGSTPEAFDYSGYTSYVYQEAGKELPRTTAAQYSSSKKISQGEAEPGDLIFFNQTGRVDHVGIYLGDGEFISAQSNDGVTVASFDSGYWSNFVVGFGRVN